ncbi:MAG: hypothetical protein JNG84_02245, partial [Archangium sp.]|nr:hypothetical protein [Archangium sp.]
MRPRLRRRVLGVVVLLAVAVLAASRTERAGAWGCRTLTARLPSMVGGPASIGRCEFDVLTLSAKVHDVTLFEDDGEGHFISIDEASVGLRGLFLGGVSVRELTLVRPRVHVQVTTATSPKPKRDTCALDRLKTVRVQELHIEEGTFSLSLPDGRSLRAEGVQVDANVGRATAEADVRVRSGVVHLAADRALTLGRVHLEGTIDLSARELEVRRADLALEGISLGASGTVSLCDAIPQLAATAQLYVPMEALPRLGVPLEAPRGQLWARVSVAGHADAPLVRADVQASQISLGRFTPGDFSGQLAWSGKTVTVDALRFKVGEGEVRVSADVGLTGGFPVRARFETKDVSLGQVLERTGVPGAWVDFPATVKGAVSGKLLPVPSLIGDVDFRTGHFTLATHAYTEPAAGRAPILTFAESRGKFHLEITDTWVDFQDIALSVGGSGRSTFTGSTRLFFDTREGLRIRVAAPSIDLSDFGAISGLPWSGVGSAHATLTGPGADLKVDGHLTLRDFTLRGYALGIVQSPVTYGDDTLSFPSIAAQKGRTQYFGDVALRFAPEGLQTRASIQLPDGRVEDVVDLLADLSPSMKNMQGVLFGKVSAVALVDGPAKTFNGVVAMRARDAVYLERRLGDADTVIRFVDGEALVLEPTRFVGPLGTTSVDGTWRFAGPLDYRLEVAEGSLQELIDPSESLVVSGGFHAAGTVSGDTDTVRANATLTSSDVHLRGQALGASSLAFELVGRALNVSGTVVPGISGTAAITAQDAWPAAVSLLVNLPDASAWLPASVTGLSLALAGAVTAQVPLRDVRSGHGTAKLSRLAVARGEVAAANVEPVELEWNDGALTVHSLAMRGPTSELNVEGRWGPQ